MIPLKNMARKSRTPLQSRVDNDDDSDRENEGLLARREHTQAHAEARNSIEAMVDDLDAIDYLDATDPLHDLDPYSKSKNVAGAYRAQTELSGLRAKAHRWNKCIILTLVLGVCIWTVLGLGTWWTYTRSPLDGASPPWYPTPQGGHSASWAESYVKATRMVEKMTLVEKVNVTTGTGWQMGLAVGNTGPATEAAFPGLSLQDGPLGLRFADNATAFPAGITVGATWNKELMRSRGKAHGKEARLKGINVLLGPCVGPLGRMPAGGRNWEGFGADPYLQGVAAAETISGIQSEGIIATIKHYIGNEQEHFRQGREWFLPNALSSNIGDRTLHEMYLWPFADAVKAGVGSVMCSYQMTNNSYSCGNSKLLNGVLKDELGFEGFVQSDWLAQRGGVSSALAGLDMTMPGDGLGWQDGKSLWGPELTKAVLNGSLPLLRLDDMVTRIVATWYQLGQDDDTKISRAGPNFSSWTNDKMGYINAGSPDDKNLVEVNKFINVQGEGKDAHTLIAQQVAAEGTVLLKNDKNILPLHKNGSSTTPGQKYRVGIFGEDAGSGSMDNPNACPDRSCNVGTLGSGWGSGAVEFPYLITPTEALRAAFNPDSVTVTDYPTNTPPGPKAPAALHDQDLCLVFVNADSGEGYLSYAGIRGDRNDLSIQKDGNALILKVASSCGGGASKTIVVIHAVGPVILEQWISHPNIAAVLLAHLPGQESGHALASLLFGDTNPSGKLPYTIGKNLDDYGPGAQVLYYPNSVLAPQQNFSEGVFIDYRHFDRYGIVPRYEFGFGMSYTTFAYSNLKITELKPKSAFPGPRPAPAHVPPTYSATLPDPTTALFPSGFRKLKKFIYPYIDSVSEIKQGAYPYPEGYHETQSLSPAGGDVGGHPDLWDAHLNVSITITNSGDVAGAEVVQLYLSYPNATSTSDPNSNQAKPVLRNFEYDIDPAIFPTQILRGFTKVFLQPGESKTVSMQLSRRDLSFWDVEAQNWRMVTEGEYRIAVGASSRDLREVGWW